MPSFSANTLKLYDLKYNLKAQELYCNSFGPNSINVLDCIKDILKTNFKHFVWDGNSALLIEYGYGCLENRMWKKQIIKCCKKKNCYYFM